jgi:hypothetical protein
VNHAVFSVFFYAVVAAASPLVLTATFVVIRSERPRTNGLAFLIGFVLGTTIACVIGLVVGEAVIARLDSHDTVEAVLTLALGFALLMLGARARGRLSQPVPERSGRGAAIMAGLRHVRPAAACSMAGLLGFGGPKRLLLTLLAMASVSAANHGHAADFTLVALYIGVATVLVWVPVGIVVVAGERAALMLERGESWLTTNAAILRMWIALGFGAAVVVDGLIRLFA